MIRRISHASKGAFTFACCVWAAGLGAQPADAVLKGSQVTEDVLVDALAIDAPDSPTNAKLRGFRLSAPQPQSKSPASGKASLLITFDTGSAVLTPEGARLVDTVARAFQTERLAGFSFTIEGHADPRGSAELNQRLSEQRAQTVVEYLVTRHGILPERLTAIGRGSAELIDIQRPTAPENRRVSIITMR